jgi:hypothetical protein
VQGLLVDKEDTRHFLLNQIYPSQQLVKVLRSAETLEKLGLVNYFVAESIPPPRKILWVLC